MHYWSFPITKPLILKEKKAHRCIWQAHSLLESAPIKRGCEHPCGQLHSPTFAAQCRTRVLSPGNGPSDQTSRPGVKVWAGYNGVTTGPSALGMHTSILLRTSSLGTDKGKQQGKRERERERKQGQKKEAERDETKIKKRKFKQQMWTHACMCEVKLQRSKWVKTRWAKKEERGWYNRNLYCGASSADAEITQAQSVVFFFFSYCCDHLQTFKSLTWVTSAVRNDNR